MPNILAGRAIVKEFLQDAAQPGAIADEVYRMLAHRTEADRMFLATFPMLNALNVMGLRTPESAILSAVIFNAIIIVALVPLALRGIKYRPIGAAALLRSNLLIYGVGGIIVPFVGIKAIDVVITAVGLA